MPSWKQFHFLLSTSWLSNFLPYLAPDTLIAQNCFDTAKTLDDYTHCHWKHVILPDTFNGTSYLAAQPSLDQSYAWSSTVSSLLNTDNNCSSIVVPDALKGIYHVLEFKDQVSMQSFCIFSEIYEGGDGGNYKKGWGLLVVPSTRAAVSRFVHLSAPFPQAGINTVPQATAVFTGIGAKSLFIPGRNRNAFREHSTCIAQYTKTSSVHDNNETFLNTTVQIRNWQNANGGCPPTSCAHIQFMGKGKSCPSDEVFISAGINDSSGWYGKNPNYTGRRIRDNLRMKYPKSNFSLPSDSSCDLIGSKNIVGRLLNGVDASKVCTEAASPANTKGEFVQLETSPRMRKKEYYEGWVEVFNQSFPPVNAAGMDIDDTDVWSE